MKKYLFAIALPLAWSCSPKQGDIDEGSTPRQDSGRVAETVSLTPTELTRMGSEIGTPTIEEISNVLVLQGRIDVPPQSMISLSSPLGGYLKSTDMLPGTYVKKGQVLAVMEDMQFIQLQQDYLTARERFQLAETEFVRQRDLNITKASSDKVFQQAQATLETEKILQHALAQKLELIGIDPINLTAETISKSITIKAPISGFVSNVHVNIGKFTSPTDILFELFDPSNVHLELSVFEKDMDQLSVGQHVTAFNNVDPSRTYEGKIVLISRTLNADRMASVHCHLENIGHALYPGMFMNAEVSINSNKGLTVPEEAVVRWENKFYVFADKGLDTFEMVEVTRGELHDGRQQIQAAGVDQQTSVVVSNAYGVLMKSKNKEAE